MVRYDSRNVRFLVVALFSVCFLASLSVANRSSTKHQRKKSLVALFFQNNATFNNNKKNLCRWLRSFKHQNKICLKRKGLPEILLDAKKLVVSTCRSQFQYDQWNCSNIKKFLKKVYRETAYLHSLTASSVMYSVAKGCANGRLSTCKCAKNGKQDSSADWQWGGCGDNTKYAKSFTTKFLQLRQKGDKPNDILAYNSKIGLKTVRANQEKICRCFGLSGSCTTKICWNRLKPFEKIAQDLKNHYHNAIQADSNNNIHILQEDNVSSKLLYLESGPNFCPATVGRRCLNQENCATLCCSRGFYSELLPIKESCNCKIDYILVRCKICEKNETVYYCV